MGGVANAVGGAIGSVVSAPGNLLFGQTPSNPQTQVNQISPQLQQMQQNQVNAATNYANNLPGYEQQQQNAATDQSRQALATQLAGNTTNSNSRGMLYGSYNQGQQAQTTAQNQANLQNTYSNINTGAQSTLAGLQSQALGTGIAANQASQQNNAAAYQAALAQQQSNSQAFGSLMMGAGSGAGLLAGLG